MAKNNYRMSPEGIDMLVEFEGEILKVYKDPVGLPTFGVGHLVKPGEKKDFPVGKKISRATSRAYLREDLKRFEDCVNNNVKVPITQNQFDALVSLAFNIGESAFKRSSVLRNLNNRQFDKAADSFRAWNKAGGKVLSGLVRRRATERSVFLTPDPSSASVSTGNTIPPVADVQEQSGQNPLHPTGLVSKDQSTDSPPPLSHTVAETQTASTTGEKTGSQTVTTEANVAVEKEKDPPGFFEGIKLKIAGWWMAIGGAEGARSYSGDAQAFGITGSDLFQKIVIVLLAAFVMWLTYHAIVHLWRTIARRWLTASLVTANSTPTNQVVAVDAEELDKLEAAGWVVVRRK